MTDRCPHCHIPKHVRISWMLGGLFTLIAVFYAGAAYGVNTCRGVYEEATTGQTGQGREDG